MYDSAVATLADAPRRPMATLPGLTVGSPDDTPVDREPAFRRQLVKADRLLNVLLALMMAFGIVVFSAAVVVSHLSDADRPMPAGVWAPTTTIMLVSIGIFASMAWRLNRTLVTGELPPPVIRLIVSVLVVPTPITAALIAMEIGNLTKDPALAVLLPFGWIYTGLIVISMLRLDWKPVVATGVSSMLQYGALSLWVRHNWLVASAAQHGLSDDGVTPLTHFFAPMEIGKLGVLLIAMILSAFAAGFVRDRVAELMLLSRKEERLRGLFGQHVGRSVLDTLMASGPGTESAVRRVCVMFLDVRGFTSFSEKREPRDVVEYLNALFSFMVHVVDEHGGVVNKFLGDGFMAVFGAPVASENPCRDAVAAAKEIAHRLEAMVAGGALPPTRIGIGLHFGEAVTGLVGTEVRREYTVIGDVVNLASRIESLNKEMASSVLASEDVIRELGATPDGAEAKGPVPVKGRQAPVTVYRLA